MTRPDAPQGHHRLRKAARRPFAKLAICTAAAGLAIWGLRALPAEQAKAADQSIDLTRYALTFDEPFDRLDVSAWGPNTRWIAHTPWNGDFGDAQFLDPTPEAPFAVRQGVLHITMDRKDGKWRSGLLASADREGRGFRQAGGGYFEMRAKLPSGAGTWPAFWLGSVGKPGERVPEIDVLEYYGHNPAAYMGTTHVWLDGKGMDGEAVKIPVPAGSLETGFHLYGVGIDREWVTFFLDRKAVARAPSKPEYLKPMLLLVDLGAGGGWPITNMPERSVMLVDYVRAYRRR
jgi:beta-glucanase (GH16 family)